MPSLKWSELTEEQILNTSTGWVTYPHMAGYLGFQAANELVSRGKWQFKTVHCWGYILERKS